MRFFPRSRKDGTIRHRIPEAAEAAEAAAAAIAPERGAIIRHRHAPEVVVAAVVAVVVVAAVATDREKGATIRQHAPAKAAEATAQARTAVGTNLHRPPAAVAADAEDFLTLLTCARPRNAFGRAQS